jgi:hypothetical protein
VGHHDGINICWGKSYGTKPTLNVGEPETAVEHNATGGSVGGRLDNERVTFAARSDGAKAHAQRSLGQDAPNKDNALVLFGTSVVSTLIACNGLLELIEQQAEDAARCW